VTRSWDSEAPPSPDQAEPGGPGQRGHRRGGVLAATAGGAALAAVVGLATLACSHQGGLPATAAAGTGQASTGTSQPGAAAASPQQSLMLVPAPDGATATGPGSTHGGTGASPAAAAPSSQAQTAPAAITTTTGELPALAEPPSSPTDSADPVPPVTARRSVTVGAGPAILQATATCASGMICYGFHVTVANFPAHVQLAYTCANGGGVWWGPGTTINSGTIVTNSSGAASFITYCTEPRDGTTVTITVGGGKLAASGRYTT
jgi:hypothetical protein